MSDTSIIEVVIRTACNQEMSERLPGCHYPGCFGACDVAATSLAVLYAALPFNLTGLDRNSHLWNLMRELYPEKFK